MMQKFWKNLSFGQQIITLLLILGVFTLPLVLGQAQTKQSTDGQASEGMPRLRELIRNGSFETDVDKDSIPDGWTWFRKDIGDKNGQDCDAAQTGQCSFSMRGGDNIKTLIQDIPLSGNTTTQLTFNAWVKTRNVESNNVESGLIFLDKKGNEIGSIGDIDRKGKHDFEPTNPNNIAQRGMGTFSTVRVYLKYKPDSDGGRIWFDNVSLKVGRTLPSPSPTPVPTCKPRPTCLDSRPACKLPTPREGWCPTPRPSIRPIGSPAPLTSHRPGTIPIPSERPSTR